MFRRRCFHSRLERCARRARRIMSCSNPSALSNAPNGHPVGLERHGARGLIPVGLIRDKISTLRSPANQKGRGRVGVAWWWAAGRKGDAEGTGAPRVHGATAEGGGGIHRTKGAASDIRQMRRRDEARAELAEWPAADGRGRRGSGAAWEHVPTRAAQRAEGLAASAAPSEEEGLPAGVNGAAELDGAGRDGKGSVWAARSTVECDCAGEERRAVWGAHGTRCPPSRGRACQTNAAVTALSSVGMMLSAGAIANALVRAARWCVRGWAGARGAIRGEGEVTTERGAQGG